jgi:hypothetical protein
MAEACELFDAKVTWGWVGARFVHVIPRLFLHTKMPGIVSRLWLLSPISLFHLFRINPLQPRKFWYKTFFFFSTSTVDWPQHRKGFACTDRNTTKRYREIPIKSTICTAKTIWICILSWQEEWAMATFSGPNQLASVLISISLLLWSNLRGFLESILLLRLRIQPQTSVHHSSGVSLTTSVAKAGISTR